MRLKIALAVGLAASPAAGWTQNNWSNTNSGNQNTQTVIVEQPRGAYRVDGGQTVVVVPPIPNTFNNQRWWRDFDRDCNCWR